MPVANTFVIGPPRTGSTSVAAILGQHPDVLVSSPKESSFIDLEFRDGVKGYNKYFEARGQKILLDANPHVSWIPYCAERIHMICPHAKIIMTVRHPVERMYSHWRLLAGMRPGREVRTFPEFVQDSYNFFASGKTFSGERDLMPFHDGKKEFYVDYFFHANMYHGIYSRFRQFFDDVIVVPLHMIGVLTPAICAFLGIDHSLNLKSLHETVESRWEMYREKAAPLTSAEIASMFPVAHDQILECCAKDIFMLANELSCDFSDLVK